MKKADRGGAKQPKFSPEGDLDTIDRGPERDTLDMGVPPDE